MSLDDQDLQKIKAVVDAGQELTRSYVEQKIESLRKEMATKEDVRQLEQRLGGKIDGVKTMLEEDHKAVVADVEELKIQIVELQRG